MQMPSLNRYAECPSVLSTAKVNKHINIGKASLTTLIYILGNYFIMKISIYSSYSYLIILRLLE